MYSNAPIEYYKNRSGKPDKIVRWLETASVLVWLVFLVNVSLILFAKPGVESFFDRLFKVRVRSYWDYNYLRAGLFVSFIQFIASAVSLWLNTKRLKRKYDRIRISLLVSAILSCVICLVLLVIVLL